MSTSLAYHTQGIVGFQHHSFQFSDGKVIQRLKRKEFRCPTDKTYSGLALWKDASLF